ncbi:MAG: bifunctional diaminohydroxyphosphoribosylaminopyrimidine deaminase/5-amino-6-(5-phosphoribosylamino)uracil reductase RibD [Desulfobacterales bacterium]|nr:bifunctional diaminohydroxyphosphoribosylaminopyrimidine deaminase/5-amino-6-(5-phosphoribosylamino)uracil reductase RibD [Desulfobacterales bacterium]
MDDNSFMQMALDLAEKGRGFTSPNPMVGAVVVNRGEVVGRGYHQAAGTPHAEVHAIDDAGPKAQGATLYVTLEPCNHTGRTPPCTEKILASGINRVVMAMEDPNPGVRGGGGEFLVSQGVSVVRGVCEARARRLNEVFVKYITSGLPFVVVKCAATLDGRIATRTGDSRWVTGEAARRRVHRMRHALDAILVGVGTVISDDPSLTTRLPDIKGRDPVRVILDTRLSIPENARVLRLDSSAETLIFCGDQASADKRRLIQKSGARVLTAPVSHGRINVKALMPLLAEAGITSVLIEGGSRVIASALAAGVADKVSFFYAPKILGGDDGVPVCRGPGAGLMSDCLQLRHTRVERLGDDILIEGYLNQNQEED